MTRANVLECCDYLELAAGGAMRCGHVARFRAAYVTGVRSWVVMDACHSHAEKLRRHGYQVVPVEPQGAES